MALSTADHPCCKVKEIPNRGQALVATDSFDPGVTGLTILEDPAVLVSPKRGDPEDGSGEIPQVLARFIQPQFWTDYWTYQNHLYPEQQQQVLNMYHDPESTKQYVTLLSRSIPKKILDSLSLDLEEFVTVCMIVRANCVDVNGQRALYPLSCRMNHSCKPNCYWYSKDGKRVVRLVTPIEKNEEFTIDYIESRFTPRKERQDLLQKTKSFTCQCRRCIAPYDDTRRFPCHECDSGVHFVANDNDNKTTFLACNKCNTEASESYQKRLLKQEHAIELELTELDKMVESELPLSEDDRSRLEKVKPPHPLHHLGTHMVFIARANSFKHADNLEKYIQACKERVDCFQAILNYPNVLSAVTCQMLADAYEYAQQYEEAELCYQKTVRMLQIVDGYDRPYSQNAISKLIQIQKQRQQQGSKSNLTSCALCGAVADKKCSRCGQVQYCSREHQKAHWSEVHKQHCQAKNKQKQKKKATENNTQRRK